MLNFFNAFNSRFLNSVSLEILTNFHDKILWIQLDQNVRAADAITNDIKEGGPSIVYKAEKFTQSFLGKPFDGGFKLDYVKDLNGNDLAHTVNGTMMRLDLPQMLKAGEKIISDFDLIKKSFS